MSTTSPGIETERLHMRWLTEADVPLMLAIWNDPTFVRHVGDRGIRTREQALEELARGAFHSYAEYGYGPFHVSQRVDGTPMGVCGLYLREHFDDPDIGFALLPEFCGRGFGWEAASAVRDYARDVLKLERMIAIVAPENRASIGLLEKLGLAFENEQRYPDDDEIAHIYAIQWRHAESEEAAS